MPCPVLNSSGAGPGSISEWCLAPFLRQFKVVFDAIRELMTPPDPPPAPDRPSPARLNGFIFSFRMVSNMGNSALFLLLNINSYDIAIV